MSTYTIEVEGDEIAVVEAALGRTVKSRRKATPKTTAAALPEVDTGDAGLDEWIVGQWARKGHKPYVARKTKPYAPKVRRLTVREFEAEEKAWADIAAGQGSPYGIGTPEQNARALKDMLAHAALMQAVSA